MTTEKCKKCGVDLSFIEQGYKYCDKCFCELDYAEQTKNSIRIIPNTPTEKDVQYYEELVYREVADKTLSFGCILKVMEVDNSMSEIVKYIGSTDIGNNIKIMSFDNEDWSILDGQEGLDYEILGHDVMIGDFLDCIEKSGIYTDDYCSCRIDGNVRRILQLWKDKRLPYSALPDDTKIELGKIVEEVLLS